MYARRPAGSLLALEIPTLKVPDVRGMSEFGSIAILAYDGTQYPFSGVSNASVLIFQYYSFYGPQGAITASAVMIVFSLLLLFIARLFTRNREASRGSVQ